MSGKKLNKVVRISLASGVIGLLATNPRRALEDRIREENDEGWNAVYFLPHKETNILAVVCQLIVLILTLFMWTWGAVYVDMGRRLYGSL